ncbi:unnamed protein product [Effrenium voratum]|uniref:Sphingomyelin synthase-like domain-containing protein n=1 Tax=Effrenium voratum TaxID=2562239 RepID=A0AA36JMC8_9DINO|nr:unnamed protein product [Effrenium voratum]
MRRFENIQLQDNVQLLLEYACNHSQVAAKLLAALPELNADEAALYLFATAFFSAKAKTGAGMAAVAKLGRAMCYCRLLRVLCYCSTVMPSQSPGCFVNRYDETYTLWEHWREAVTHMRAGGGCNDLIFSGHASVLTFTVLMHADLGAPRWLVAFLWGRLGHAFLRIVQSRSHLSVDVVVACILALLLWHVLPEVQPHPKAFTSKGLSPEAIGWSSALCGAVAVLLALLGAPAAGPLSELNRRRLSQVAAAPSDSQEPPRIFCAMMHIETSRQALGVSEVR